MSNGNPVFITGGTGYIGTRLIPRLQALGYPVVALAREQSKQKLPPECRCVIGDALDGDSYKTSVTESSTFIHLVGVSHPGPAKARQFVDIDKRAAYEAIRIAAENRVAHFIYLSVAHPAPVMRAYIDVRASCEREIRAAGLNATVMRPWYVLGPGHRWPYLLIPFYRLAELLPSTRESARRLGLVTLQQMVNALASAAANPPKGVRVVEVPEIKNAAANKDLPAAAASAS